MFVDTEVFRHACFNYRSSVFVSLVDLGQRGRVRIFLTGITIREIRARIRFLVEQAAPPEPKPILKNSTQPQVQALFAPYDADALEEELLGQLDAFMAESKATVLSVEDRCLTPVLKMYFGGLPPFGSGKKKSEFPDALVVETLEQWTQGTGLEMSVVSGDSDFQSACMDRESLHHFPSLLKYLDAVASEDEVLSDFIRDEVFGRTEAEAKEKLQEVFSELAFVLTDQDGDVEYAQLTDVEYEGDVEIVSLTARTAVVELPTVIYFSADVRYRDPASGSYDPEDDIVYSPDETAQTVQRKAVIKLTLEVGFADLDPDSLHVLSASVEGNGYVDVESGYSDPYEEG